MAERHRFAVLDGWRGLTAVLFAVYHLMAATSVFHWPLVRHAQIFVDFFFVLSGFVISYAFGERLRTSQECLGFAVRRFGRMWPLHVAVLAAMIALEFLKLAAVRYGHIGFAREPFGADSFNSPVSILSNLSLVQALGIHASGTWNAPAWSVSAEFWVNLLYAVAVLALARWVNLSSAILAALGALVIARFSNMGATYDFGFFRCLYGFFVGVLARQLWASAVAARRAPPPWAEVAACVAVGGFVWLPLSDTRLLAGPLLFGIAVPLFAFEAGPVSRLMRARPIHLLGLWSYSIYMVHWLVLQILNGLVRVIEVATHRSLRVPFADAPVGEALELIDAGAWWINDLVLVAYVGVVLALAAVTFRTIEEPARLYFNRLARNLEQGGRVAAAASRGT